MLSQLSEETLFPCCGSCDTAPDFFIIIRFTTKSKSFKITHHSLSKHVISPPRPHSYRISFLPSPNQMHTTAPETQLHPYLPATHVQMHMLTWAPQLMSSACMKSGNEGAPALIWGRVCSPSPLRRRSDARDAWCVYICTRLLLLSSTLQTAVRWRATIPAAWLFIYVSGRHSP